MKDMQKTGIWIKNAHRQPKLQKSEEQVGFRKNIYGCACTHLSLIHPPIGPPTPIPIYTNQRGSKVKAGVNRDRSHYSQPWQILESTHEPTISLSTRQKFQDKRILVD